MKEVYLYDWLRSARGRARPDGALASLSPFELLKALYDALRARTGMDPAAIGEVILGCVTQQGEQAGNIAKTSVLYAGWPHSVAGLTVNRFCSSGLDAIALAGLKIAAGQEQAIVAGGVEMMSRVPMLADRAAVFVDPALAAACRVLMMGSGADLIASLEGVTREEADAVALASQQRAASARANGWFASIVPVRDAANDRIVSEDECIRPHTSLDSLARMEPAFAALGAAGVDAVQLATHPRLAAIAHIHTAGNSPAMADGAALLLLGDAAFGERHGLRPRARLRASVTACGEPLEVLGGCIAATRRLLDEQGLASRDVDLFEVHEAFAATVLRCQREFGIDDARLNVNGGVIALGHPLGATGAMMAGTLLDELERRGQRLGLVAASGAAGSGSAMLLERLS